MAQPTTVGAVTDVIVAQLARHLENADSALNNGDVLRASAEIGGAHLMLSTLAQRLGATS